MTLTLLATETCLGLTLILSLALGFTALKHRSSDMEVGARRRLLHATLILLLTAGFLALAVGILRHTFVVRIDAFVAQALFNLRAPWLDRLMMLMSALGDGRARTTATVLLVVFLLWRRRHRWALALGLVMIAAAVLTPVLKTAFHLARPSLLYSGADAFSFPSGHATSAAALYLVLTWIVSRSAAGAGRALFASLALAIVLLTALSRIYLGAHWLSDVLAGLALGVALGLGGVLLASGDDRAATQGEAWNGGVVVAVLVGVALVLGPKAYGKAERLYAPYLNRPANRVVDPGHLGGAPGHRIIAPPGV